jgi:hypothetical protein
MLKLDFKRVECRDSTAFKIVPSNSPIISCLNFILIPTPSGFDSNFKHGPTMNFNGKEMKWMMMLELLSLGLSFLQVVLRSTLLLCMLNVGH